MANQRRGIVFSLVKGLLAAVLLTLMSMVAVAAAVMKLRVSDATLTLLNQLIKLFSVLLGVYVCVGRGGRRGFLTGMTLAMLYMVLGYGSYAALGGGGFAVSQMLGEVLLGSAVGALFGAILANWGGESGDL